MVSFHDPHRIPKVLVAYDSRPKEGAIKGSCEQETEARKTIRQRQIVEARVHEELQEEYDWMELRKRWWPQVERVRIYGGNEGIFDPAHDFRREMVRNEDGGYCG